MWAFQSWNKAYNISVQMVSLANKYATVLDAIDFMRSGDEEKPDNVNILAGFADLYGDKLGTASEKRYYIDRVRKETLPSAAGAADRDKRGWRRTRHDVMLDDKGFILPRYLTPHPQPPGQATLPGVPAYDSSELQYLADFNTPEAGGFPYGLSPMALGANYFMRTNVLVQTRSRKHLYLSDNILDSRPAIHFKFWAEEELERGRRAETMTLLGNMGLEDRDALETTTAGMKLDAKFVTTPEGAAKKAEEAIFSYRRTAQVADAAIKEYLRHITSSEYTATASIYQEHIDDCQAMRLMASADRAYLSLIAAANGQLSLSPDQRTQVRQLARKFYREAIERNYLIIVRHYVPEDIAAAIYPVVTKRLLGKAYTRYDLEKADPRVYQVLRAAVGEFLKANKLPDTISAETPAYNAAIARATARLEQLGK
jgi:hypothetical protein